MKNIELKQRGWWCEDDPEHLVYFQLIEDNIKIWESSWYDIRDFDHEALILLRNQIYQEMLNKNILINLSDDFNDWEEEFINQVK